MWIDAQSEKPTKRHADDRKSEDVLIWIEFANDPTWAYYDYKNLWWIVHNMVIYPERVQYFAYIDNPYK
jgi:hypothetical protein